MSAELSEELKERLARILKDQALRDEIEERIEAARGGGARFRAFVGPSAVGDALKRAGAGESKTLGEVESIVLALGRPVLNVQDNTFNTDGLPADAKSREWVKRLAERKDLLDARIPSIGRINLKNHTYTWVGTGWMIAPDIVVTNNHVARFFAGPDGSGTGFPFKKNPDGLLIKPSIDFRQEHQRDAENEFRLSEVLYMSGSDDPDVAFLRIGTAISENATLPVPVPLADEPAAVDQQVAVIGYPARDSQIPDPVLMREIFGDIYDVKRLAPGAISGFTPENRQTKHDASTLGGNSGSAVLDLATGRAVGLHRAGAYKVANYAVPIATVRRLLADL